VAGAVVGLVIVVLFQLRKGGQEEEGPVVTVIQEEDRVLVEYQVRAIQVDEALHQQVVGEVDIKRQEHQQLHLQEDRVVQGHILIF
jgi:hypothetical protein